jgi:pimeloyl-ACP methyl ester carboxylesterase
MAKTKKQFDPADHIQPLYINGLNGRVLRLRAKRAGQREMLLLYGSHSSIERMVAFAQELNRYGDITLPDWPGFGAMDSLFKIGEKPTLDTMADYLASFIRMRYRKRRFTIVGMSYGFVVATRMLQKHPDIAKQVDLIVSIVGFTRADDFRIPRRNFYAMKYATRILRHALPAMVAKLVIRPVTIRATYNAMANRHSKMKGADYAERKLRIDFEVILWRVNDLRTYFYTANTMFTLDLCKEQVPQVPVYHVAITSDQFFDNHLVEQHLHVIYPEVQVVNVHLTAHMPTVVASPKEVAPFFPAKLRKVLAAKP